MNGTPRAGAAKLSTGASATLDPAWQPSANNQPAKIVAQPEGVYVAGYFSSINGAGHGYLARLDKASGALDPGWQSSADNWVLDLLRYYESMIAVGVFSAAGGTTRQAVARLPVAGDTVFIEDFDG